MPRYIRSINHVEIFSPDKLDKGFLVHFNDGGSIEYQCSSFSNKKFLSILRTYRNGFVISYLQNEEFNTWVYEVIAFWNVTYGGDATTSLQVCNQYNPDDKDWLINEEETWKQYIAHWVAEYGEETAVLKKVNNWEKENKIREKITDKKWIDQNEQKRYAKMAAILCLTEAIAAAVLIHQGQTAIGIAGGIVAIILTIFLREIIYRTFRVLIVAGVPSAIICGVAYFYSKSNPDMTITAWTISGALIVLSFVIVIILEIKGTLKHLSKKKNHTMAKLGDSMDVITNKFTW